MLGFGCDDDEDDENGDRMRANDYSDNHSGRTRQQKQTAMFYR